MLLFEIKPVSVNSFAKKLQSATGLLCTVYEIVKGEISLIFGEEMPTDVIMSYSAMKTSKVICNEQGLRSDRRYTAQFASQLNIAEKQYIIVLSAKQNNPFEDKELLQKIADTLYTYQQALIGEKK